MQGRAVLRGITPPFVATGVRRLRQRGSTQPAWEYLGTEWVDDRRCRMERAGGRRRVSPEVAEVSRCDRGARVHRRRDRSALLDCSPRQYDQNVVLEYAYAVARASAGRDHISILDWGGGFGFMSFVVRELFPDLDVDFHVKEVPPTAAAARELVDTVTFWDDDSCLDRPFDLVSACSSLQYERELGIASDPFRRRSAIRGAHPPARRSRWSIVRGASARLRDELRGMGDRSRRIAATAASAAPRAGARVSGGMVGCSARRTRT